LIIFRFNCFAVNALREATQRFTIIENCIATKNARKGAHGKTRKTPVKQASIACIVFYDALLVLRSIALSRR